MGFLVATMLLALAAPAMAEENNNEVSLRATVSNQLLKQTSTDTCISVPAQCPYYPSNQLNQCFSGNIIPACEIGCSYAAKYWGTAADLPGANCAQNCQFTVWAFKQGQTKCNYNNGLGINVPELQNFGAGKACRIGCVIGNRDEGRVQ